MEDMMKKMGEILSDPESLRQLQELAQMFQHSDGEASDASEHTVQQPDESAEPTGESGSFDFGMLLKIQELMGSMQNADEDTKLLLALRPHLQQARQKKVDQAVKLLKLYAVFIALKENGLLQDLL